MRTAVLRFFTERGTTVSPKTYGEDATERLLLLMGTISAMIAIAAKVYEFRRRKEEE